MELEPTKLKAYIYRWRDQNKERYLEISRVGSSKYYQKNKDKKKAYAIAYYHRKRAEQKEREKNEE